MGLLKKATKALSNPSVLLAGATLLSGERTNAANAREADENRDFQQYMSGTAYQRQMADMKSAGLNPLLASKIGGASTPPGGQATMFNSAKDASKSYAETKLLQGQLEKLQAEKGFSDAAAKTQAALEWKARADADLAHSTARSVIQNVTERAPVTDFYARNPKAAWLKEFGNNVGNFTSAISDFSPLKWKTKKGNTYNTNNYIPKGD